MKTQFPIQNPGILECDIIILGGHEIIIKDGKLIVKKIK